MLLQWTVSHSHWHRPARPAACPVAQDGYRQAGRRLRYRIVRGERGNPAIASAPSKASSIRQGKGRARVAGRPRMDVRLSSGTFHGKRASISRQTRKPSASTSPARTKCPKVRFAVGCGAAIQFSILAVAAIFGEPEAQGESESGANHSKSNPGGRKKRSPGNSLTISIVKKPPIWPGTMRGCTAVRSRSITCSPPWPYFFAAGATVLAGQGLDFLGPRMRSHRHHEHALCQGRNNGESIAATAGSWSRS